MGVGWTSGIATGAVVATAVGVGNGVAVGSIGASSVASSVVVVPLIHEAASSDTTIGSANRRIAVVFCLVTRQSLFECSRDSRHSVDGTSVSLEPLVR